LDDTHIPSVRQLDQFLRREPNWRLIRRIDSTDFFLKTGKKRRLSDWQGQGINRSLNLSINFPPCRAVRQLCRWLLAERMSLRRNP
jgi:hypothetical protein